jgi:hypothetical protein
MSKVHKLTPKATADKTTARLRRIHGSPAKRSRSVLPKSLRPVARRRLPTKPRDMSGFYACLICLAVVRRIGKHSNHRHPGQVSFERLAAKAAAA